NGHYKNTNLTSPDQPVHTITKFLQHPNKHFKPIRLNVSAHLFRYSPLLKNPPPIPQTFPKISQNLHPISSIIYPSHSTNRHFRLHPPHTQPYKTL
ncbi:putative glycoside hydrolase, partial [Staphylococcus haemolyticus]|uniref:putative glycoside hydrolase n=1 Tax=Staphylococcus haemolyticus TaxID=1283 RepID=UPI001C92C538